MGISRLAPPIAPALLDALAAIAAAAPDPWSRQTLEKALADERRLVLVAAAGGPPLGFASFFTVEQCTDLEMLAVLPAARRKGTGRQLLEAGIEQLKQAGSQRLLLEVRAGNAPAIGLYQGLGFKTLASRPAMYAHPTEDGLLMGMNL